MAKGTKKSTIPKFINKTQEVYQFIVSNPGKNEKEILQGLKHMNAPVVHASLKSLSDGGYVTKTETSETNKLGRNIYKFSPVAGKTYEPTYSGKRRGTGSPSPSNPKPTLGKGHSTALMTRGSRLSHAKGPEEMTLTLPTPNGPMSLPLSAAQGVYNELRKIFDRR